MLKKWMEEMDNQVVRYTVSKLFSREREVRLETLKEISVCDGPDYDKALVYFFRNNPSIEEKIICIRSFKDFHRGGVLECIEEASDDEYFEIRWAAFKRVSKLKTDQDLISYAYLILKGLVDEKREVLDFCLDFLVSGNKYIVKTINSYFL